MARKALEKWPLQRCKVARGNIKKHFLKCCCCWCCCLQYCGVFVVSGFVNIAGFPLVL